MMTDMKYIDSLEAERDMWKERALKADERIRAGTLIEWVDGPPVDKDWYTKLWWILICKNKRSGELFFTVDGCGIKHDSNVEILAHAPRPSVPPKYKEGK